MQLITHQSHLDALPESSLKTHLQKRFDQLSKDTDLSPNIILVETTDDITSPDYAFVDPQGVLSDLFEEHEPGDSEFYRPYEWISYLPSLEFYEALLLINNEEGIYILYPFAVAQTKLFRLPTSDSSV